MQKYILPTIIGIFLLYNLYAYFSAFSNLQKLTSFREIVNVIKSQRPTALYGVNDITPSLSYYSGTPLLSKVNDTNANIFRKGFLDAKKLSSDALKEKTLLITHGADYPEFGIRQDIVDEIFDTKILAKCKLLKSYPVQSEGVVNRVNVFRCY